MIMLLVGTFENMNTFNSSHINCVLFNVSLRSIIKGFIPIIASNIFLIYHFYAFRRASKNRNQFI